MKSTSWISTSLWRRTRRRSKALDFRLDVREILDKLYLIVAGDPELFAEFNSLVPQEH